jgi:hypothetical protein
VSRPEHLLVLARIDGLHSLLPFTFGLFAAQLLLVLSALAFLAFPLDPRLLGLEPFPDWSGCV